MKLWVQYYSAPLQRCGIGRHGKIANVSIIIMLFTG